MANFLEMYDEMPQIGIGDMMHPLISGENLLDLQHTYEADDLDRKLIKAMKREPMERPNWQDIAVIHDNTFVRIKPGDINHFELDTAWTNGLFVNRATVEQHILSNMRRRGDESWTDRVEKLTEFLEAGGWRADAMRNVYVAQLGGKKYPYCLAVLIYSEGDPVLFISPRGPALDRPITPYNDWIEPSFNPVTGPGTAATHFAGTIITQAKRAQKKNFTTPENRPYLPEPRDDYNAVARLSHEIKQSSADTLESIKGIGEGVDGIRIGIDAIGEDTDAIHHIHKATLDSQNEEREHRKEVIEKLGEISENTAGSAHNSALSASYQQEGLMIQSGQIDPEGREYARDGVCGYIRDEDEGDEAA
ncbi:MAG: hypothetical protein ACU0AU_13945 [Cognatishimia activa]